MVEFVGDKSKECMKDWFIIFLIGVLNFILVFLHLWKELLEKERKKSKLELFGLPYHSLVAGLLLLILYIGLLGRWAQVSAFRR